MYDEYEYWNNRRHPNHKLKKQKAEGIKSIQYIKDNIGNASHILDFGPGVGRTFPAYEGLKSVEGFDVTNKWSERLFDEAEKYGFEFQLTTPGTKQVIDFLPYDTKQFDAAVAISVLFHQRPDRIEKIMTELARVAQFVIATGTISDVVDTEPGDKSFYHHDYFDICARNRLKMSNVRMVDIGREDLQRLYFVFKEVQ